MEPSQRRGQEVVEEVAPLTIPAMWSHESGPCVVGEDGCWTSANFPAQHGAEGNCAVSVDPSWTGFLFAEYMRRTFGNEFYVDGEPGPASGGQLGVHGMSPRNTLRWSPERSFGWTSGRWKICQVDALPLWTVTVGEHCSIDRLGCFETEALLNQRVLGNCFADSERCVVELSAEWEGSLDVVDAHFIDADDVNFTVVTELEVNGRAFPISSVDDISRAGVQGMVAKNFTWTKRGWGCAGVKICPAKSTRLPGPWGDDPWTCTELGDSCTLPFELNGISFSACTQQLSDPDDADQDGSLHNGHPQCKSANGLSLCGPCSCGAGQEQTYNVSRVYPHTPAVELVACAPCEAGRFKSFGGSGAPASCEQCAPGTSSSSGATACSKCLPGLFSSHHESLECASCQPGYFGSGSGLTTCQLCDVATHTSTTQQTACLNCLPGMFKGHGMLQCDPCSAGYFGSGPGLTTCLQCAVGNYSSTEGWTACDSCLEGSVLKAQDSGCQECSPGTYRRSSMTSCSSCAAGRFQNTSGQSGCHQCSAVLDAQGPNPHLWTTMTRTENMEWQEIWGSQSERDCGCAAGAWIDALGHCQECGVGLSCRGMGELEVLPGYFTSADNAGFVWRCHGPDWARCPGGLPGTCAQGRRNSTTCEECEPYTRKTDDGPCKAR